ncbi:hypothetical protein DPMN_182542 [Dreissena polymorpha]|uniref:Uncharacterized protein n=2 Tax=Dreissena polymorpha TaxID=45954 RepID=A0A9D4I4P3_DREPO|nr:hypothetical protein DPMN_182542 [Dreissena polymorpha]
MSNVTLEITKDSPGLFETLLETSIRDLKLIRFSYESNVFAIVPTLRKLKSLTLIGCHCKIDTLILPLSLQTLCLVKSHGSFARNLKSCLVKLANLRHPVTFKLYECGIDPLVDNEPNKNEMFNIVMEVCNNSPGLHGILQGTSIRGLKIRGINNVTELLLTVPTLGHLEILSVEGIHLNRFQLQFPKSLKYICFPRCSFSPIGMLGLLLQLAVIGHPVKCEFLNCEAISGKNMHASEYEFSELLNNVLHDMSEINLVAKFSPGLRDMLNAITTICHNMQKVKYIPGC